MMSYARCVEDVSLSVTGTKRSTLLMLDDQGSTAVQKLRDQIENAKRKIMESAAGGGSGMPAPKKQKQVTHRDILPTSIDKENSPIPINRPKEVLKASTTVKPSASKVPVSRSVVEFKLSAMKVLDLRSELKAKGLPATGKKRELVQRLLDATMAENEADNTMSVSMEDNIESTESDQSKSLPEVQASSISRAKATMEKVPEVVRDVRFACSSAPVEAAHMPGNDHFVKSLNKQKGGVEHNGQQGSNSQHTIMNLVDSIDEEEILSSKNVNQVGVCTASSSLSAGPEDSNEDRAEQQQHPPKLTAAQIESVSQHYQPCAGSTRGPQVHQAKSTISTTISDTGSDVGSNVSSTILPSMRVSGSKVREMVSKITGSGSTMSQPSPATSATPANPANGGPSTLSNSVKKKQDARKQRLLELRGQSKPLAASKLVSTPNEYTSALSTLKAAAASTNSKKKNLTTQMREKAAAAYRINLGAGMKPLAKSAGLLGSASKMHTNSLKQQDNHMPKAIAPPPPLPPRETYEISDREDSDTDDGSDSDDDNNEKRKKKIPKWASKTNLLMALEKQYTGTLTDPDRIFPPVQTCDLEAIFDAAKKKAKYTRRTSSGNWTNDSVTVAELLVYKRTMGFTDKQNRT